MVIYMRKYFLFDMSDRYYSIYLHKERLLFRTLESLYNNEQHQKANNISLYNQLCVPININYLNSYFSNKSFIKNRNNKHLYISKKTNEKTLIEINYSCVIILTNKNFSRLFKVFNYYSKRMFVCDFQNQDYFWLDNQYLNNYHNNEYN